MKPHPPHRPRSIRTWLLRVSLVAVLPMGVLLLGVTVWGLHMQARQREASLQRQVARAADAVQGLLDVHLARIGTVAVGVAARQGLHGTLHEVLVAVAATDPAIASVSLVDGHGRRLVDSRVPWGVPLPPSGTPDWDRSMMTTGQPAVSPWVTGTGAGETLVGLAVPVVAASGEPVAVLQLTLAARALTAQLQRKPVPHGWVVAVLDRRGVVVARNVDAERFVGQPATASTLAVVAAGPGHVQRALTMDGRIALTAAAPVGQTGWHVVMGAPEDAIEREQARAFALVLVAGLLAAALSAGLSMRLGRRVADSVRAVAGDPTAAGPAILEVANIQARFDGHQQAQQGHERALHAARLDALTGLPERGLFSDEAARRLATLRPSQALGLLFIDLDGFKALNDRDGHEAGDRALAAVGALLRELLRPEDLPGRLGGDEFVVALVAPRAEAVARCGHVAQRLVDALPRACPGLGCSVGIAVAAPGEGLTATLERADHAMFEAKRAGKGRIAWG